MSGGPTFMSRWSQRKLEARKDEVVENESETPAPVEEEDERDDAEILEELGLKDPDELGDGDDFAAFMNAAVPEKLRNRALRKLWVSNPVLANLDELVEYGEDYTLTTSALEKVVTAYQVGKGYLKPEEESDGDTTADGALADDPGDVTPRTSENDPGLSMPESETADIAAENPGEVAQEIVETAEREPEAPPTHGRQRMTFKF